MESDEESTDIPLLESENENQENKGPSNYVSHLRSCSKGVSWKFSYVIIS